MRNLPAVALVTALAVAIAAPAAAAAEEAAPPPPARVPLTASFSRLELVTIGVVTVAGVVTLGAGEKIFGEPTPSLGPPGAGSFDRRVADSLHLDDGSGHRFLWRAPDIAGLYVLPYLPGIVYGLDAVAEARAGGTGRPLLFDDPNAAHRFFAYTEALGWTTLAVGITKFVVGRTRPYAVLDHPELAGPARERDLSFYSSHAAASFAMASFVALDASRRLAAGPLARASAARRFLLATLLPYLACFGTASLVAISRVIDQQHWPSDVLVGAGAGAAVAHLAYLAHFDGRGDPRVRDDAAVRVVPMGTGLALAGRLP